MGHSRVVCWLHKAMYPLEVANPTSPSQTQTSDLADTIGHCNQFHVIGRSDFNALLSQHQSSGQVCWIFCDGF